MRQKCLALEERKRAAPPFEKILQNVVVVRNEFRENGLCVHGVIKNLEAGFFGVLVGDLVLVACRFAELLHSFA